MGWGDVWRKGRVLSLLLLLLLLAASKKLGEANNWNDDGVSFLGYDGSASGC